MVRVAVVFDDMQRPETTGTYCRRALARLSVSGEIKQVRHFLPSELPTMVEGEWDLLLAVDDGLDYEFPRDVAPIVWWAIDSHIDFDRVKRRADQAAWTFAAQKNGADRLKDVGINAEWLPLACDPDIHGRRPVPSQYDLSFVGNVFPGERQRLLALLKETVPSFFVGQKYFGDMADVFSASKLVFNRSIADDINMRVFEGICSGSLLITNDLPENGQSELFEDGVHYCVYRSDTELLDRIRYYLANEDVRNRIAIQGQKEVLSKHTYLHRMRHILDVVFQVGVSAVGDSARRGAFEAVPMSFPGTISKGRCEPNGAAVLKPQTSSFEKSPAYFDCERPEILNLVPKTASRILDIGCGTGALGNGIKRRQAAFVVGVEIHRDAAKKASLALDDVVNKDVESTEVQFPKSTFDCVICADILEHVRNPQSLLSKIRGWLSPTGRLVISVPNVRNHTVIKSLLAGNWTYESAGLLDEDHIRFFTRSEIEKLLFRCGFDVETIAMVPGEGFSAWLAQGKPNEVSLDGLQLLVKNADEAEEFYAYQYLIRATPQRSVVRQEFSKSNQSTKLEELTKLFPWPESQPRLGLVANEGWFADGAQEVLTREASEETRIVVELGTWLGMSTRFLANKAPSAKVIAIDHWKGSPEHEKNPEFRTILPHLFDSFIERNWDYRNRIIPMRLSTRDGLRQLAQLGVEPDLVFVDADHQYQSVKADLHDCREFFPNAVLTGDDYDAPDVRRAVHEIAEEHNLQLNVYGDNWRAWKLSAQPVKRLTSASPSCYPLTSIIVVTWNQLAYTQLCLDSLFLRTDEPFEIIVVDNGSTDGTVEYLRRIDGVKLIVNETNRGFPAAVNQGLQIAQGANLLLLNNDTIVTTGWLRGMLDALCSDTKVGIVGPVSNFVGSEQQIPVDYKDLMNLDGFAWSRRKELLAGTADVVTESNRIIGFCFLFRRELLDRIGLFDEQFGIGCFEDDDFCLRAIQAGYRTVIAQHAFVHHFGSVTFRASGVDFKTILEKNGNLFAQKWSLDKQGFPSAPDSSKTISDQPTRSINPDPKFRIDEDESGNLILRPGKIRVSGCLIVRNNEKTIRQCLESLKPWVDEIIVVDTGSTDSTATIAAEIGASVSHWAWQDDFAAARNVSVERARGEWIFWMDSDDVLPVDCGQKLRSLVHGAHSPNVLGYVMQVHCPGSDPTDLTVVDHVKLFRNRPELRFEFRIHEQILPAIRRAGGEVEFTDIHVVHSGYDRSPRGQADKLKRDFKLLELELRDRPDHPFVLFNLGMTHADCGQYVDAIRYLEKCIDVSGREESHVRKAFALLTNSLLQNREIEKAHLVCLDGLKRFPDDKELLFRLGMLQHQLGQLSESVETYQRVMNDRCDRHFTSVDSGLGSFKARHNLALVYEELGDFESAAREWQAITDEQPHYAAAWRGLVEVWIRLGKMEHVKRVLMELDKSANAQLCAVAAYGNGLLLQQDENIEDAITAFRRADQLAPEDSAPLRQLCRLLFATEQWSRARTALEQLAVREPKDASVPHNLGIVLLQAGEIDDAANAFRHSLCLRPNFPETMKLLAEVLGSKETHQRIQSTVIEA